MSSASKNITVNSKPSHIRTTGPYFRRHSVNRSNLAREMWAITMRKLLYIKKKLYILPYIRSLTSLALRRSSDPERVSQNRRALWNAESLAQYTPKTAQSERKCTTRWRPMPLHLNYDKFMLNQKESNPKDFVWFRLTANIELTVAETVDWAIWWLSIYTQTPLWTCILQSYIFTTVFEID